MPDAGEVEVLGDRWRGDDLALRARLGIQLQETKFPEKLTVAEVVDALPQLLPARARRSPTCSRWSACTRRPARRCARSRAGRSSGCRSAARWSAIPSCSSSTSRRPASIRSRAARPGRSSRASRRAGGRCCSTTHYMEEAARLCDRVAVVDHGKVIALGTPRELIASLGAEHVVEFAVGDGAAASVDEAVLGALPSVEKVVARRPGLAADGARGAPRGAGAAGGARGARPRADRADHPPRDARGRVHGADRTEAA